MVDWDRWNRRDRERAGRLPWEDEREEELAAWPVVVVVVLLGVAATLL